MRKIINNYDWKLFCIETEIELVRKEKNMLKEELLKKDYFIADCEVRITELSSRVCSLEEELRLICDENNFFEMQISQKQMKIDELQADVDAYKDIHDFKEMSYQMKEKEDELKEMAKFLREKINENHELKIRTG
jgi:chromosome segregation ATPase